MPIDTDRWDVTGAVDQTGGRAEFEVLGSDTSEIDNKFNDAPANPDISSATWRFAILMYDVTLDLTTGGNTTEFGLYTSAGNFFLERTSTDTELVVFTSSENYRASVTPPYDKTLEVVRDAFTFSDWGGSAGYDDQKSVTVDDVFYAAKYTDNIPGGFASPNSNSIISNQNVIEIGQQDVVGLQGLNRDLNISSFDDDFDFEMDLTISDLTASAPIANPAAALVVIIGGSVYVLGWIQISTTHNGVCYYNGTSYTELIANQTGGSWNLRISRVGSTVKFYVGDEEEASLTKAGSVTLVEIGYNNGNGASGANSCGFKSTVDNLSLTVGGVEYTEDRVFFNEDSNTRYVYDNGAVDVSSVSIKLTSNEATTNDTELIEDFDFESPKGTRYQTEM
ncbi:MAG: hypothetical protein ACR2PH_08620 [Desulfobulbia bacterium]